VIGHEFSHILNGDMRLNIRLMGVLFGILALGLIGRIIVRGAQHSGIVASRRNRGAPVVLVVGLGLIVLGGIGVFFARVIKAGVSRQREFLADASAVQFTRQSDGLANALKKIGGYAAGSYLRAADPEEVSHMLFGSGARLSGLFATHPPLVDRIRALDPQFQESDYPAIDLRRRPTATRRPADVRRHPGITTAFASGGTAVLPETIAELVGRPENEHIEYAEQLRESIPADLYDAAHSAELAYLLTIALLLDRSGRHVARQLNLAAELLGSERAQLIRRYHGALAATGAEYRLPLLEIAFPALKLRPAPQLSFLIDFARRAIEIDGEIDLYEYCFYRILIGSLGQAVHPAGRRRHSPAPKKLLRDTAVRLLGIVAEYGHDSDSERQRALHAGLARFGSWARNMHYRAGTRPTVAELDASLDVLLGLGSAGRQALINALSEVVSHDNMLTVTEAELLRAICAALDCPLPPILVHRFAS